jgi:phage shock protein PspC (stress-responsive transcriptional regulator)
MIDRALKIFLVLGACAAIAAITLSLISGTHVHSNWTENGTHFDINVGTGHGFASSFLGTLAVICLVLGGAFLALTKKSEPNPAMSSDQKNFSFISFLQNLKRSKADCVIGGVCGGLGAHSPVPSWVWRALFLVLLFCFGTGLLAYVILWICVPEEKPAA